MNTAQGESRTMTHQHAEPAVMRTIPIPVSAFNHVKDTQRKHEAATGVRPSLNETFALLILDHQRLTAINEQRHHVPAILQNRP